MNALVSAALAAVSPLTILHSSLSDLNKELLSVASSPAVSHLKSAATDAVADFASNQHHLAINGQLPLEIPEPLRQYFTTIREEINKNMEAIGSHVQKIDWMDMESIMAGLRPLLDCLKPVLEFVQKHPWILIPLIPPIFELFLVMLGFGAAGVAPASIAAALQSYIGDVPKGSLFALFQSVGAEGWAFEALHRSTMFITIAVITVAVGKLLVDMGIIDPGKASQVVVGAWNRVVEKFDPTPVPSTGHSQG